MCVPTPPHIVAQMRQAARDGATLPDIADTFGVSYPTAVRYTKGINSHRAGGQSNPARLRRILAAHASGIDPADGAARFHLKSPKSFRDMASYARARVGVDRLGASSGPGCRPSDRTPSDFAPAGIHPSRVEI